jgi:regulator of protease activity HflC (stomatin/prohibitin superfamily)
VAELRPHKSERRARLRAHISQRPVRPRVLPGFFKPGRNAQPGKARGAPPEWFQALLRRHHGRRALTLLGGIIGLLLIVAVSGARVVRQDIGHVGVIRNGGPIDTRSIRQIVDPGSGLTWTGWFSQSPHEYPASQVARTYTITSNPKRGERNGTDVVTVPTADGVQIGIEATLYYHFIGERDHSALKAFDKSIGTRKFAVDGERGSSAVYAWDGDNGWNAMIESIFRPILENDLRAELGLFHCAELVSSCKLLRRVVNPLGTEPGANIARIERTINRSLETELTKTLNHHYFWGLHFRIAHVSLPANVQAAIDTAQASYARVADSRAKARQAKYDDRAHQLLARTYDRSPALANIEGLKALKSVPKGSTIILSGSGKGGPQVLAGAGN